MKGKLTTLRDRRFARFGSILLTGAFLLQQPLSTATITVSGGCTLADAITAANTDTATGACAAGAGADTIELTEDVTLMSVLPVVTDDVTIEGNDATIGRDPAAPDFRILQFDLDGDIALRNVKITNGIAVDGGGIFNGADNLTLFNTTVIGNEATSRGGGIYSDFNTLNFLMQASTVADNDANKGAGLYTGFGAWSTIENSTVSGNSAGDNGGGIYNAMYAELFITNSTISGNDSGDRGGGLYNQFYAGDMNLVATTISGNSAIDGGGVYAYPSFDATEGHYTDLNLTNTLIANNVGGNCLGDNQHDLGGNFDDDGTCLGASAVVADVDFDTTLANNGGPTLTHALFPGGAPINTGGACGIAADQRGFARDVLCDSGAVEFGAAPVGGSIRDIRGITATCRNNTTGSDVTFGLGPGVNTWDCEAQGLAVSPGDVVTQSVQGGMIDGVGGTVIGLAADRVACRNTSTGQSVNLLLNGDPSWDCLEAGLTASPGDRIRMISRGQVP